jgi:putative transcriptional regulator
LRNGEQGRRIPKGPARVLLRVIERNPEAVRRAIG